MAFNAPPMTKEARLLKLLFPVIRILSTLFAPVPYLTYCIAALSSYLISPNFFQPSQALFQTQYSPDCSSVSIQLAFQK
jgi:hypothetical protein